MSTREPPPVGPAPGGPLPQAEFEAIYARVPRLTVEVVIASAQEGVVLTLRTFGPCRGLWHIPGGTVRFGEPLVDAVARVARDELGVTVAVGDMLGYIEYPSHYENGLDCPVGLAFAAEIVEGDIPKADCDRFAELPAAMHDEQRRFLGSLLLRLRSLPRPGARISPGC
jgi:ADP-ribose pyrophosphatase YjhB (NUDIX family)